MKMIICDYLRKLALVMYLGIREGFCLTHCIYLDAIEYAKEKAEWAKQRLSDMWDWAYDHLDETLRKQGTPPLIRLVAGAFLAIPAVLVRFGIVVVVVYVWSYEGTRVAHKIVKSYIAASQHPNKKRTPKKTRPLRRLDDFDDVRARIRELLYPEQ